MPDSPLLDGLTAAQKEAVLHKEGPCLVVAGAGTGKTTVITRRIAYLIQERGVDPECICALTFTEKAAGEMEERVDVLLPYGITAATVSTFHSFCADLLKRHAFLIGIDPTSRLLSSADEISFLRLRLPELPIRTHKLSRNPVEFLRTVSACDSTARDAYLAPQALIDHANQQLEAAQDEASKEAAERLLEYSHIYEVASQLYRDTSLLTYGDLLYYAAEALRLHPSARAEEQERYTYFLIDEFQDTNTVQNEIARLLAGEQGNIMAVGDDDQAIYSFRGANLANILQFSRTFQSTRIITLADNFRSNQQILDTAYRLIQHNNPDRLEIREKISKRLKAHIEPVDDTPVQHWHFERGIFEYQAIAEEISRLISAGQYRPEEIAILVRARSQVKGIEGTLQAAGIASQFSNDSKFYLLPVVQQALAFLRFLADCHNDLNLFFLLGQAPFSVPEIALQEALRQTRYHNTSLYSYFLEQESEGLPESLTTALTYLKSRLESGSQQLPSAVLLDFLHSSEWYTQITSASEQEPAEQLAMLYQELLSYEAIHRPATVQAYIRDIDLLLATEEEITLQQANESYRSGVQVMTIHKSKGLEFGAVFLINLVQGRFPSRNMRDPFPFPYELVAGRGGNDNLAEERRLAYVALTRAKEKLYLTSSELYEERKTKSKLSPFVAEAMGSASTAVPQVTPESRELLKPNPAPVEPKKIATAPSKPARHSASSLETYEQCPYRYRYQYVMQLKVPSSHLSNFGTSVHETLKSWFIARQAGQTVDIADVYKRCWLSGGYENKQQEELRYAQGLERLQEYTSNIDTEVETLALEFACKAKLPDGTLISGKLDRADRVEGKRIRIVDYKTGENPKKPKDLVADIPLATYVLAMQQRGYTVEEVELHYLIAGQTITLTPKELGLPLAVEKSTAIASSIAQSIAEDTFPAKPDKIVCAYCDYRTICPFRYGTM